MRLAILMTFGLALAACTLSPGATGQASHSAATPTASATASPTPNTSPFPTQTPGPTTPRPVAVTCSSQVPTGLRELALVTLRKTAGVVVRDITDIAHPVTRCVFTGPANFFRFVSATRISYMVTADNGDGALYLVDLQTQTTSLARAWTNEGSLYWVYAWSPDTTMLSYLSSQADQVEWHLLSAAGDVTLSKLGSVPGRGVDPNNDDAMTGFSADGQYIALEETFTGGAAGQAPPLQIVRLSDRKPVYTTTNATMAVWLGSGATMFYRSGSALERWDAGEEAHEVSGSGWIRPRPSGDGGGIVYTSANAQGNHFPRYMTIRSDRGVGAYLITLSAQPRDGATFLTPRYVWYAEEAVCGGAVQCGIGGAPRTGRTFVRDIVGNTETVSTITAVFDSWPHVATTYYP